MKKFMRSISYILVLAMLMGFAPLGVFADAATLAVNVTSFTEKNNYLTNSTAENGVLTVVPNSSKYNNIQNGTTNINLMEQTNPVVVNMEVETAGDMTSFRFFTYGSLQLNSKDIPTTD